jgi:hypothetical protein
MYPDPERWAERLKNVPAPLRNKQLASLDAAYLEQGFKARSNGKDANGNYIDVDIKPGTDLKQVYEFLQSTDTAAITVEPVDVERIYGKSAGTLAMRRAIEINGAASQGLELIEPDGLADALTNAGSMGVAWEGLSMDDAQAEKFITDDLIANGLLSEQDVKSEDAWAEAKPEQMGLRIGDHSDRYNGDMGDFQPDYEAEEAWGEEL